MHALFIHSKQIYSLEIIEALLSLSDPISNILHRLFIGLPFRCMQYIVANNAVYQDTRFACA